MKQIKKDKEPASLLEHRKNSHANYDNYSKKDDLRDSLVQEQGYICCYCMQRITPNPEKMKIEHHQPQKKYPKLQLDYKNLLASCKGNDGGAKHLPRHCDTSKGEKEITINPADKSKNCETLIKYKSNGRIYSDDLIIDRELNDILNLNTYKLVHYRKEIIDQVKQELINIKGKKREMVIYFLKKRIR